jgi:hypothetical protein
VHEQEAALRDVAIEERMRRRAFLCRDVPSFQALQEEADERFFNSSPMPCMRMRAFFGPLDPSSPHRCAPDASAPPARPFVLARNSWLHRDLRHFVRDSEEHEIAERHLARGFHIGLGRTFRQAKLFDFLS